MRLLVRLLVLLLAPGASAQEDAVPAPPQAQPTWYAQALTRGDAGLNVTHFWSKGAKLRAETVVSGHKVVTIVHGEWYWAYDGLTLDGVAIRRDPRAVALDDAGRRPFGDEYLSLLARGAEMIEEEQLMGRPTGVFRVTDDFGRRQLWVTLDKSRIPLRVEVYDRKKISRTTTDYLNWQSGLFIPDAFFKPDPNAKLDQIDFAEYVARTAAEGPVGPVPVLYTNLLTVRDEE